MIEMPILRDTRNDSRKKGRYMSLLSHPVPAAGTFSSYCVLTIVFTT